MERHSVALDKSGKNSALDRSMFYTNWNGRDSRPFGPKFYSSLFGQTKKKNVIGSLYVLHLKIVLKPI